MKKWLLIIILFLIPIIPVVIWYFKPATPLNVVILDKTVPTVNYREHQSITWLLNYLKIVRTNNKEYSVLNYMGYHPEKKSGSKIVPLENEKQKADLIYLADTYGVYHHQEERYQKPIYGGTTSKEVSWIDQQIKKNHSTVIAEYNTLESPTSAKTRADMEGLFGIHWTGWIGRYFPNLQATNNPDLPSWVPRDYKNEYGKNWAFKGSGFVLSKENGDILVLQQNKHVKGQGIHVSFTAEGRNIFHLKQSPNYNYWFDILNTNGAEKLATYQWQLTSSGKDLLLKNEIPLSFPAITMQTDNQSRQYYFAGDYADSGQALSLHQYEGIPTMRRWFASGSRGNTDAFFWKTYVPLMTTILKNKQLESTSSHAQTGQTRPYYAKVNQRSFSVLQNGKWKKMQIKGVNIGISKPGKFPGETAITQDEYYRWLTEIRKMHANTIRVYTLNPPGFYQALYQYNKKHSKNPIYLFQGVWVNEPEMIKANDAYNRSVSSAFQHAIKQQIDVIHGNANVRYVPGNASGIYSADISQYVIGWIIGIEWDPDMVVHTNALHKNDPQYRGDFIYTKGASPFESWLAGMMNTTVKYEQSRYHVIRPLSFTNWVTTDLLKHPGDPLPKEDEVSVNPDHIYLKKNMPAGEFASYHIYPYYPDSLNLEKKYLNFKNSRGKKDNYAGYLKELDNAQHLPILVAEFGVPSSRGKTHNNPFGMNQGQLSEEQQGKIDASLYQDIKAEHLLGGLIFSWQDEWFKRTWNTMDYDDPNRRPFWSNAQTSEQQFGMLSFDRLKIKVDGLDSDWKHSPFLYRQKSQKNSGPQLVNMQVDHDERYLYLKFKVNGLEKVSARNRNNPLLIYFDTRKNAGNQKMGNVHYSGGSEFVLYLDNKNNSRILVDSYYDMFYYQYTHLNLLKKQPYGGKDNTGIFNPEKLVLNKVDPKSANNPLTYETGKLTFGNGNPDSKNYNSLSDYFMNRSNGIIEIRIPWLMLNFRDPSQLEIMGDMWQTGLTKGEKIKGIKIGAMLLNKPLKNENPLNLKASSVINSFPKLSKNRLSVKQTQIYSWKPWNTPQYSERLKKSYYIMKKEFETP
ncbi:hypothetical protein [Sporolactobacillus spathodeae]|uniref:Family 2 glycosyl transferase n=1 Tax=Sporolactobacillus spathodeae TaxID=1465502 RepID=A0ABS2Q4X3_9BACL|nr:hypothetical protein [Sporolactobacillus spathodeae]MBM7656828.1 hypothetical protein [Sporolactobacillus spathodeae]